MKFKLLLLAIILIFCIASSALALTEQERLNLIAQLQNQIAALMQQIVQVMVQQNTCHTFNNNLGWANSGSTEILYLHAALQRQGISYAPDGANIYYIGTSNAVVQFQQKYGISQTGYVGPNTRNKLNQLYGCGSYQPNCTPNWQAGTWGTCVGGQQSRTAADLNNCGTTTNRPETAQSCTVKPINITANGSEGPLNLFLTIGNGASVNADSGITLSRNINLQWTGNNVASCRASDSSNPSIFSGYVPSSSLQTVTLSGTIQGASSYWGANQVSDTFQIACVTLNGDSVSDSVTVNLYYNVTSNCAPYWNCTAWSACNYGQRTRTCSDSNACGSTVGRPSLTESCAVCAENWQYGNWSACVNSQQTRTATDSNNCGTTVYKLATTQSCYSSCTENWQYGNWSACVNSQQTRTAADLNNCGTTIYRLLITQYCYSCTENWTCASWSACVNSQQTRICTDSNNCGTTASRPVLTQSCVTPSISITSPSSLYYIYSPGQTMNIAWNSQGIDEVVIVYNGPNGISGWVTPLTTGCPGSDQSKCHKIANNNHYDWVIPSDPALFPAGTYNIQIFKYDPTALPNFAGAPSTYANFAFRTITLTSPNGGETWRHGETHNITWTLGNIAADSNDQAYITMTDASNNWYTVNSNYVRTGAGTYSWTVPASIPAGSTYKIKVRSSSYNVWDSSNNSFTITAPIGSVDLKVNGSDGPLNSDINSMNLRWTSSNVTSCNSSWAGSVPISGSAMTSLPPGAPTNYTITCTGVYGTATDSVLVYPPY